MEITPDRQLLAAAGFQHIRMYDISNSANQNPLVNYENVSKNVTTLGFHENGVWMYTGGEDCFCRIWDLRARNLHGQRLYQTNAPINTCHLHPNQRELYIGDQNGFIHIWDLRKDTKSLIYLDEISIQHLAIDSEGTCLVAVDNKGNCYMLSLVVNHVSLQCSPLQRRLKLNAHKRYALKCGFSPDSTLLATTSADQTVKLWRTADLLPLVKQDQEKLENSLSLSNSWPTADNISPMIELKDVNQRWVWDLAFSADSQYVITGNYLFFFLIYLVLIFFSTFILKASSDNMARLWSINNGEVIIEYSGHQKAVTALAFSDGFVE